MDKEELEIQYSPSRWSHRFRDPDQVIKNHMQVIEVASSYARKTVPLDCAVRYGPGDAQLLDMFGGQSVSNDAPVLVYVHGGYWQDLSRELSANIVVPQYDAGVRVAVVGYDLAPAVTVGDIIKEIEDAATYVVTMATKLGSRSVWFCGHSAGAQLVSMLLFSGWLDQLGTKMRHVVKGLVLISGVFDLTSLVNTYVNDALKMTSDYARARSPLLLDVASSAVGELQVLVTVGEYDSPEFQRQSKEFAERLQQFGVEVQFDILPGVDHFSIVENLQLDDFTLTRKILDMLFRRKQ